MKIGYFCNITNWKKKPYTEILNNARDIATLDNLSNERVEVGVGRGIYGREALHLNIEADVKDQAKNKFCKILFL